jgi:hypothetical protein
MPNNCLQLQGIWFRDYAVVQTGPTENQWPLSCFSTIFYIIICNILTGYCMPFRQLIPPNGHSLGRWKGQCTGSDKILISTTNGKYICITYQHDALFFTLFRYRACTCFKLICSPSSGGQVYNVAIVPVVLLKRLSAGLSRPTDSRLPHPNDGLQMSPKHVEAW